MHFNRPMDPNPDYAPDVLAMRASLEQQAEKMKLISSKDSLSKDALPSMPDLPSTSTKWHHCRLLLSHLGFLTDENRSKFIFLDNNKRFLRSLKELDKVNSYVFALYTA